MGNTPQAGSGYSAEKNEIEVVEQYDIVADRQQMNDNLVNSEEVDQIVSTIEVYNMDRIFWRKSSRRDFKGIGRSS